MSNVSAAPLRGASAAAASDRAGPRIENELTVDGETIEAPPVVAVIVASNPGEQFAEMLQSLGEQDYENLSVLVIDAGSDEPIADQVAEVLPEAYLHRLTGDPGWSVAANQSIELVSGSPFLLFCHDDVALDESCVSRLMGELYRQNAGIAGPKMVGWDDEQRLLQIGMGSDRFGVLVDQVERGEFDQQQYDDVRDVFVAPGGVQLIRADLFLALGGFDTEISLIGEDLDLCWRAHALGARVLAVSEAAARHKESMDDRLSIRERSKLATRHRLRTVMITSSGRSRFTVVPLAMLLIVLEGIYYLLSGRRGQARDMFSAIAWNLTRLRDIRRRRRTLRAMRTKTVREVRSLQISGSAAVNSFSRGQFTAGQDRFSGFLGAIRSSFQGEDSGSLRDATVFGFAVAIILVFGSRHLLTRGLVPVGQFPVVPSARELFEEWWGGWRSTGTGGPGNPPTALVMLAAGRALFFWAPSVFDKLLAVGPVLLGVIGAFRLTRPLGSARSAAIAATFYAASPLIVSTFAAGRWEALVVYGAAPFLLGSLLRIDGVSPYGSRFGPPGMRVASRSLPVLVIRFGILVAVVAAFAPSVVVVAALMALAFAVGSLFTNRGPRFAEFGLAAAFGVIAPAALHLPWSFDVLRSFSWRWLVGPASPEAGDQTFADLIQFAAGGPVPRWLGLGLVAAAVASLMIAPRKLLGHATQCWTVALVLIGAGWAANRGWLPFAMPAAETLLAPALAALVVVVAIGIRAFEQSGAADDPAAALRPAMRRAAVAVTAIGLTASGLGAVLMSLNGGWSAPTQNYVAFTEFLTEGTETNGRVLWIGDASVVPVDVAVSGSGIQYAVTDGGSPQVWGRWAAGPVGVTRGIGEQLDLARSGETVRLGRLLAPYGVDFVVVVDQLAPAPYEGPEVDPGPGVVGSLTQQLDLQRVQGVLNMIVFRNVSASGVATLLPSAEAAEAVTSADQLDVDLAGGVPVEIERVGSGRWSLLLPGGNPVLVGVPSAGLVLGGHTESLISGFDDLTVVPSTVVGEADVSYPIPLGRRAVLLAQLVIVVAGAILAQTRREVGA